MTLAMSDAEKQARKAQRAAASEATPSGEKGLSRSRRIWDYVRDHPHHPSTYYAKALGLRENNCSSILSQLESRKMIKSVTDIRINGAGHKRAVKQYAVAMRGFELLPAPVKLTRKQRGEQEAQSARDALALAADQASNKAAAEAAVLEEAVKAESLAKQKAEAEALPAPSVRLTRILHQGEVTAEEVEVLVNALTVQQARLIHQALQKLFKA